MKKAYIGFDVGGTSIEAGLVSPQGKILNIVECPTQNKLGKKKLIENIINTAEQLMEDSFTFLAMCLGWPRTDNVAVRGKEIKGILEKKFSIPIIIDNDANLFALAEAVMGSGKHYSIVMGLTLGTGIGSGLIINKKIYHGRKDASEIGHAIINFNGPKCNCGSSGCFEEYASSKSINRLASKYGFHGKNGEALYKFASRGNPKAIKLWEEFGKYLGVGLTTTINAYDPEVIILGGQLSKAYTFFNKSMRAEIKKRALLSPTPIRLSKLNKAAIIGAALLAKSEIK